MRVSTKIVGGTAIAVLAALAVLLSRGKMTPDEQFVRDKIPLEIQSGRPIVVRIASLYNGTGNEVGIRCSPETWRTLMEGKNTFSARLLSSTDKATTRLDASVPPGSHKMWPVESFYNLFYVYGDHGASAVVQIAFPNAP